MRVRLHRAAEGADAWMLSRGYGPQEAQTTRVLVRLDELNQPGAPCTAAFGKARQDKEITAVPASLGD